MFLNPEKQRIIAQDGNVLVIANPGTGKTRLLAYKYADLVKKGIIPEQILCLTFTEKAKKEMEARILEVINKEQVKIDISKLNVYTFHSYALDNIEDKEVLDSNLLRYAIFEYLKKNEVLNYGDEYLIETIVPKMENLIRYLKSFGIMPKDINLQEVKLLLGEDNKNSKEEMDKFAEYFVNIFKHYEDIKDKHGADYSDLLIKFLQRKEIPKFEYVLVDELQDVNVMEADIAIKSAKNIVAVGDKKQAIFGFQGGSILNFEKFGNSEQFVLSENFRSTNEILTYAREYFVSKTKEASHKEELKSLRNAEGLTGGKPAIYNVEKKKLYSTACELVKGFKGKTAIIARTNYQIMSICKELDSYGMNYSTTFFSASTDAKKHIINFLKGVISNDVQEVKNSMFTPYFPCKLQDAFLVADKKHKTMDELLNDLIPFKKLRESVKTVEDVNTLFKEIIIPISVAYGKEYVSAAITMQNAYCEALTILTDKNSSSLMSYLQTTDLLAQESDAEKDIIVTTVHKSKGKEFDNVIYLPSKTNDNSNFQDKTVEAILKTKGITAKEELEEETIRVNFVAFTRAKKNLVILTDKAQEYINTASELKEIEAPPEAISDLNESKKRAYDLFVNKQFDEAKDALENKKEWMREFVKKHFDNLDHISFTSLPESAYQYFVDKILRIKKISSATNLGSEVHDAAERILKGEGYTVSKETEPFIENVKTIISTVKKEYPETVGAEYDIRIPLRSIGFDSGLHFTGKIDAIFKNKEKYLIVDWKTDKKEDNSSKHRQQLEAYKRTYSQEKNIPLENIKVAIGFTGLRTTINTGKVNLSFDDKQPSKTAYETFSKKVEKLLSWINNTTTFFKDFEKEKVDDNLWKSIVEEWRKEWKNPQGEKKMVNDNQTPQVVDKNTTGRDELNEEKAVSRWAL